MSDDINRFDSMISTLRAKAKMDPEVFDLLEVLNDLEMNDTQDALSKTSSLPYSGAEPIREEEWT